MCGIECGKKFRCLGPTSERDPARELFGGAGGARGADHRAWARRAGLDR